MLIVQKYGGTSVGSAARIRRVARRIRDTIADGNQVIAVVSAMGHTTDRLIALAKQVNPSPPARELDMLVANGETITAPLVAMCLLSLGVQARSFSGYQAGVRTSRHHSKARIRSIDPVKLREALKAGITPIVAGFQGVTDDLEITTLGRGGSDTTAVALAAAVDAEICEIYTDVDGILTSDPRVVANASLIPRISYEECLELASVGAKVMHPRAVEIGELYGVPIHVRSSFHHRPGTMIVGELPVEERNRVRAVAMSTDVCKITVEKIPDVPGTVATLFVPLGEAGISVDHIVQNVGHDGTNDLTFTVGEADLAEALILVEGAARELKCRSGRRIRVRSSCDWGTVTLVGTGMVGTPGVAGRMFKAIADRGINIDMITTSEIRITCVVRREEVAAAAQAVHDAFELDQQ